MINKHQYELIKLKKTLIENKKEYNNYIDKMINNIDKLITK